VIRSLTAPSASQMIRYGYNDHSSDDEPALDEFHKHTESIEPDGTRKRFDVDIERKVTPKPPRQIDPNAESVPEKNPITTAIKKVKNKVAETFQPDELDLPLDDEPSSPGGKQPPLDKKADAKHVDTRVDHKEQTIKKEQTKRYEPATTPAPAPEHPLSEAFRHVKEKAADTTKAFSSDVAIERPVTQPLYAPSQPVKPNLMLKQDSKNNLSDWAKAFEQLAQAISFRLRNPLSTGPATRAQHIMNNAWWTAATTGGASHLVSRYALEHGGSDAVTAHLPGWLDQLGTNQQAAVVGGAATLGAGLAAWLTGLGTSKGRDEIDKQLAQAGKLSYYQLDADTPLSKEKRRDMARVMDTMASDIRKI
jgi:hypothetical protein